MGSRISDIDLPLSGNAFVDWPVQATVELRAVNRRGRAIEVRVLCSPFKSTNGSVNGAMLLIESSSVE